MSNDSIGTSLKSYILLTFLLPNINFEENLSIEDIFYNRYYWFIRFCRLKEERDGYDPGLNQQEIRLIEEVEQKDINIDWNVIQEISDCIDSELK